MRAMLTNRQSKKGYNLIVAKMNSGDSKLLILEAGVSLQNHTRKKIQNVERTMFLTSAELLLLTTLSPSNYRFTLRRCYSGKEIAVNDPKTFIDELTKIKNSSGLSEQDVNLVDKIINHFSATIQVPFYKRHEVTDELWQETDIIYKFLRYKNDFRLIDQQSEPFSYFPFAPDSVGNNYSSYKLGLSRDPAPDGFTVDFLNDTKIIPIADYMQHQGNYVASVEPIASFELLLESIVPGQPSQAGYLDALLNREDGFGLGGSSRNDLIEAEIKIKISIALNVGAAKTKLLDYKNLDFLRGLFAKDILVDPPLIDQLENTNTIGELAVLYADLLALGYFYQEL